MDIGHGEDPFGQLRSQCNLPSVDVEDRQATKGMRHPEVTPQQLAKLACPAVGGLQLRIGVTAGGNGGPQSQLHFDFHFSPLVDLRQVTGESDSSLQKGDRLTMA